MDALTLIAVCMSMGQQTAMPSPWRDPGFAKLIWVQSPNFGERPSQAVVDTVVVHSTANASLEGTTRWFCHPESQVSAHFTIGKDGSIVQHVSTFSRAWHAGKSVLDGKENLNDFSLGIELVNLNDGKDPYPEAQTTALRFLIGAMRRRFDLKVITSHEHVALPHGRKSDPLNFPWKELEGLGLRIERD